MSFLLFIPPQIVPLGSHLEVIRLITGHYHSDQSSDSLGLLLRLLLSFGLFILECKFLWPLPEQKKVPNCIGTYLHFKKCMQKVHISDFAATNCITRKNIRICQICKQNSKLQWSLAPGCGTFLDVAPSLALADTVSFKK